MVMGGLGADAAVGAMAKPSVMVFPAFALAIDYGITGVRKEKEAYWLVIGLAAVAAPNRVTSERRNKPSPSRVAALFALYFFALEILEDVALEHARAAEEAHLRIT